METVTAFIAVILLAGAAVMMWSATPQAVFDYESGTGFLDRSQLLAAVGCPEIPHPTFVFVATTTYDAVLVNGDETVTVALAFTEMATVQARPKVRARQTYRRAVDGYELIGFDDISSNSPRRQIRDRTNADGTLSDTGNYIIENIEPKNTEISLYLKSNDTLTPVWHG